MDLLELFAGIIGLLVGMCLLKMLIVGAAAAVLIGIGRAFGSVFGRGKN